MAIVVYGILFYGIFTFAASWTLDGDMRYGIFTGPTPNTNNYINVRSKADK